MDTSDFMTRTTSIFLAQELGPGLGLSDNSDVNSAERLNALETKFKAILENIFKFSDFLTKYDITTSKDVGSPMIYVHTNIATRHTYLMEAFPVVAKCDTANSTRKVEDLEYHRMFETVIHRYTKSNQKPNQVLRDTRSAELCYRLSIKVEAVPPQTAKKPNRLFLLHEFLILHHLWERNRQDMLEKTCGPDQMIGFPMPFEFANIVGSEYDFSEEMRNSILYYDISGQYEKIANAAIPPVVPEAVVGIASSLSYLSFERLGPSLSYLMDLMRTQGKTFALSTALKIYDQLICRLMVMHKHGVVHCDPNPTCLFLGPGETCNVLYISDFSAALLKPEPMAQVPRFHDRFVSHLRFRDKRCHYAYDLESAFYIFIYTILGKLPWDMRIAGSNEHDSSETTADQGLQGPPTADFPFTSKTVTLEDKEKFWQNPEIFSRVFRMTDLEFHEPLYQNFSMDLIESLYAKTKEALATLPRLPQMTYSKDVFIPGSQVYNIYFGLRRTIVTYFRFESISLSLKDPQGTSKVDLLNKQCTTDRRIAWDLSHWCWNYLDSKQNQLRARRSLSMSLRPKSG